MKAFFKKIWEFIKKLFHVGCKVVEETVEETKEVLFAQLQEELEMIEKEIECATGEALERL